MTNWPILFPIAENVQISKDAELTGSGAIGVLRLTGESGVGKTSWLLRAIARPPGHADGPPIVGWDYEGGLRTHALQRAVTVYNMLEIADPIENYRTFNRTLADIEPGQYAGAIIDPAEAWEDVIGAYILKFPNEFGYSLGQLYGGGKVKFLYWGALKAEERRLLKVLLSKVEVVAVVNHLAQKFVDNQPVPGQKEPKGKRTLQELATMTVYLIGDGASAPAGFITKSWLEALDWDNPIDDYGNPTTAPLLPKFMPEFTPQTVRKHLANPETAFGREDKVPDLWQLLSSQEEIATIRQARLEAEERIERARRKQQQKEEGERLVENLVGDGNVFPTVTMMREAGRLLQEQDITLENTAFDVYKQYLIETADHVVAPGEESEGE